MDEGNFSLEDLEARVDAALLEKRDYVAGCLARYEERQAWRREAGVPVLALCGHNRCGKDTAAAYLGRITPATYGGSSSSAAMPILAAVAGVAAEAATAARQRHLDFWIRAFHLLRRDDPMFTLKLSLGLGDFAVGIRCAAELDEATARGIIYRSVWIDNPRVPANPTVEYGPEDCDLAIHNGGSRRELFARLRRLAEMLRR